MKTTYDYRDIIDLEYFIHQDQTEPTKDKQQRIKERDRRIFLDSLEETDSDEYNDNPKALVGLWLQKRREQEQKHNSFLPGTLAEEVFGTSRFLFIIAGLLIGGSMGFSLLHYTGERPVNVFVYLTVIVLSQLVLLLCTPIIIFIRQQKHSTGPLLSLAISLINKMYRKGIKRIASKLSADRQSSLDQLSGLISGKHKTYGSHFLWPFFLLFQLFGICFNIGVLAISLLLITISDIGFGWQSTIQLSSKTVHTVVGYLATPWKWLAGSGYHPTFEEIEGSRIILKEGIYSLSTAHLTSWWPFLILSVVVYGLLPRLSFLILGIYQKKRCLDRLSFDQSAFSSIIRRMTTPIVSSSGLPDRTEPTPVKMSPTQPQTQQASSLIRSAIALVPDDLYDSCDPETLGHVLQTNLGLKMEEVRRIDNDYPAEQQLITEFGENMASSNRVIFLLAEGWMAPIEDFLSFIKELRQSVGSKISVIVGLIGRPTKDNLFTPVNQMDFQIWQNKIDSLADPYLSLDPLIDIGDRTP